jgi:membrane associated rhomboid family serine protease
MGLLSVVRKPFRPRYFNATLILVAINVMVYLAGAFSPNYQGYIFYYLGLVPPLTLNGFFWQPFTYMFVHANLSHLFFNMLGLYMIGVFVERRVGSTEFLLYYLLCGTLAGAFSLGLDFVTGVFVPVVGASGAIYSILLLFAVLFPRERLSIWGVLPIRAPVLVLVYAAYDILSQVFLEDNVAHLTHLAGFLFGYLYILIRFGVSPIRVFRVSKD